MASTEVVTLEQVEDVLLHGGKLKVVDEQQLQQQMLQQVLNASSLEQAFADFNAPAMNDIAQQLVNITDIAWAKSAFKDGPACYALLTLTVEETGEQLVRSCGGASLMAGFIWAIRHDALPLRGSFYKEQSKSNPERAFWTFKLAPLDAE